MKKNDIFELEITDMGTDGEGIGHYDGMTFFVKDALIGDVITARATKLKKNYGYARVEEIKTPSTFRVEPQCELHKRCGGCQIQALSYEKQLEFKNNKVRNNLMRIGGFSKEELDSKMQPPVGADSPYRYRNKKQRRFCQNNLQIYCQPTNLHIQMHHVKRHRKVQIIRHKRHGNTRQV